MFDRIEDVIKILDKYDFSEVLEECLLTNCYNNIYHISFTLGVKFGDEVKEVIEALDIWDFTDYLVRAYGLNYFTNVEITVQKLNPETKITKKKGDK